MIDIVHSEMRGMDTTHKNMNAFAHQYVYLKSVKQ